MKIEQVIGSVCLYVMFVLSGINKIVHYNSTVDSLLSKVSVWPFPRISIWVVIIIEILCPLIVVYYLLTKELKRTAQLSSGLLIAFTIIVTLIYHPLNFDKPYMKNLAFFSNLSLLGGCILLHSVIAT